MARPLNRAIHHDKDYARGNSIHGDRKAAKDKRWIDHDAQWPYCTHWAFPKMERFAKPDGKIPERRFRNLPSAVVATLRNPAGHRIRTIRRTLLDAARLGVPGVEVEFKHAASTRMFILLRRYAKQAYGKDWRSHVEVKVGHWVRDWDKTLKRAKRVGFKTTVIQYGQRDPKRLPAHVDQFRR